MPAPKELNHPEGFCEMHYRSDDGEHELTIWNSRDGVTPFCVVRDVDGKRVQFTHVEWHRDRFAPGHVPAVGDLIFVDTTEELMRPVAEAFVDRLWPDKSEEYPMNAFYDSREEAIQAQIDDALEPPGQPITIEVDEDLHKEFKASAEQRRRDAWQKVTQLRSQKTRFA